MSHPSSLMQQPHKASSAIRRALLAFSFPLLALVALLIFLVLPKPSQAQLTNPILHQPDPFITTSNGQYLLLATPSTPGITIWASSHLESIESSPNQVWSTPTDGSPGTGLRQIESPTIWNLGGSWWIYFSATFSSDNGGHGIFALKSDTSDPLGTYTYQGQVGLGRTSIDPSLIFINGTTYLMYVGTDDGYNGVYITALSDPMTPTGANALLIYPDQSWERGGGTGNNYPVAEGPTALYNGSNTFIVYSGSDTGTSVYCLGLLTYAGSGDPTDYHNWSKTGPVLSYSSENGVYGPGRGTFTTSPDGTQNWILYAAKTTSDYTYDNRFTRAQQFTFNNDGSPNFGIPVSLDTTLDAPAGEP